MKRSIAVLLLLVVLMTQVSVVFASHGLPDGFYVESDLMTCDSDGCTHPEIAIGPYLYTKAVSISTSTHEVRKYYNGTCPSCYTTFQLYKILSTDLHDLDRIWRPGGHIAETCFHEVYDKCSVCSYTSHIYQAVCNGCE